MVAEVGYDRITLRRSQNRNRIFYYLIPVLLTGTGICHGKSGAGRTGTGFFRIESSSGKNRISRADRNSGWNRNFTNAIPARAEILKNDKNRIIGWFKSISLKQKDAKLGLEGVGSSSN